MHKESGIIHIAILLLGVFILGAVIAVNIAPKLSKPQEASVAPSPTPGTMTPKPIVKSSPTPKSYPTLSDSELFNALNVKRVQSGVGVYVHDNGTCKLVDRVMDFIDGNGRLPYVPDLIEIENKHSTFLNPKFATLEKISTVDQAVQELSTRSEYAYLITSGEFKFACIKSMKGYIAFVTAFN